MRGSRSLREALLFPWQMVHSGSREASDTSEVSDTSDVRCYVWWYWSASTFSILIQYLVEEGGCWRFFLQTRGFSLG